MSFLFKKNNNDNKAKLEYKLYLSREDPGPVFDISDCGLKNIPAGTYVLCKVFRKTILYLQKNQLSSLVSSGHLQDLSELEVLDLSSNIFSTLPDDIMLLSKVVDLDVSHNHLKLLPESIGHLSNLRKLNVSHNYLKNLPKSIGNLINLRYLNVRGNKSLTSLPVELCMAVSLEDIILDAKQFVYPPSNIASKGIEEIMKFLSDEAGLDYKSSPPSPNEHSDSNVTSSESDEFFTDKEKYLQEKIRHLEILKEQKQKQRMNLEKELEEQHKKELQLRNSMKATKDKLLEDLVEQQSKLETEILRLQQDKELERQKLISHLQEVEESASLVVSQLLALSENSRNSTQVQHLLTREREEEEKLLNMRQEEYQSLRRKEVLDAMESLLEEECKHEAKLREYEEGRVSTTRTLLSREVEADKELISLLTKQTEAQNELVKRLQKDEELQRAAVAALLERSDARSMALVHQVAFVESQLATLTAVEMERRKLQLADHIADLAETRLALSSLLLELMCQQAERRQQLLSTLEEMERRKDNFDELRNSGEDFWLMQYQRLLDTRPYSLVKFQQTLDPMLTHHLVLVGAIHCLPFLLRWMHSPEELSHLTDDKLREAGVTLSQDRIAILDGINSYLAERQEMVACQVEPSAPQLEPSAPPPDMESNVTISECTICMEVICEVIFIPCGHLCCCIKCTEKVNDCPLCRSKIEQKVRVIRP